MRRYQQFVTWIGLLVFLVACGGGESGEGGSISVTDAWARTSPMANSMGAVYMTLVNDGRSDDELLSVRSDVAMMTEIHQTSESGGMMQMSPVQGIVVPGNGQAELKPGGYHIMLMGVTEPLQAGQQIELTLRFAQAGEVTVTAEVRDD